MVTINAPMRRESQNGRPVGTVTAAICDALFAKKPKARYPLLPIWHISRLMPVRLMDSVLRKRAGLVRQG